MAGAGALNEGLGRSLAFKKLSSRAAAETNSALSSKSPADSTRAMALIVPKDDGRIFACRWMSRDDLFPQKVSHSFASGEIRFQ